MGLVFDGKRAAREGSLVTRPGEPAAVVGSVTSGSYCPTLGAAAAMAMVDRDLAADGTPLDVLIRDAASPGPRRPPALLSPARDTILTRSAILTRIAAARGPRPADCILRPLDPSEPAMAAAPKFAKTHEWIRLEDDGTATVGISAYAVEALTDLVFMQLPEVGRTVKAGESIGEIESVKAVSDFYAPVSGEVVEVNADAAQRTSRRSARIPTAPAGSSSSAPPTPAELAGLLDEAAYDALVKSQPH